MSPLNMVASALGALLLASVTASAQQGTGELRGRVIDGQSAVLPGVTVVATNEATGQFRESVTGVDGSFFMSALTPGLKTACAAFSATAAATATTPLPGSSKCHGYSTGTRRTSRKAAAAPARLRNSSRAMPKFLRMTRRRAR